MTLFQYAKVIIKCILILPVIKNGVIAIIKAYKEQNDLEDFPDVFKLK